MFQTIDCLETPITVFYKQHRQPIPTLCLGEERAQFVHVSYHSSGAACDRAPQRDYRACS